MAVTLTVADAARAVRVSPTDTTITAEITRLLSVATAMVERYAPNAPSNVQNEAAVRIVGYSYDAPFNPSVGRVVSPSALRHSGASGLLAQWRTHRAGIVGEEVAAAAAGGSATGNPLVGVRLVGNERLLFTYQDGTAESITLPTGGGEGGLSTQQARQLAELVEFETAFIKEASLGQETKQLALSNAGYATGIAVPAARTDREIRVTVFDVGDDGSADATFTFDLQDLLDLPSVSGAPILGDTNSVHGTGDSGNIYRIARSAGGHFVTGGDTTGTFRYAFVQHDIDATPFVEGIPTNTEIDARVKPWARTGGPVVPADQLGNAPTPNAAGVAVSASEFDGNLATTDTDVQKALQKFDDYSPPAATAAVSQRLKEIEQAFDGDGWANEESDAQLGNRFGNSKADAGGINFSGSTYTQGPAAVNKWIAIRIRSTQAALVAANRFRLLFDTGDPLVQGEVYESKDWGAPVSSGGGWRRYVLQFSNYGAGETVRVQVFNLLRADTSRLDPDQYVPTLTDADDYLRGDGSFADFDTRAKASISDWAETGNTSVIPTAKLPGRFGIALLEDSSHGLSLTSTASDVRGAAIALTDAPDLDDTTHGVFTVEAAFSVTGSVGGLQAAVSHDDALVHASEVAAQPTYQADTSINGVKASTTELQNASGTKVGAFSIYIGRNQSDNTAIAFVAFEADGGSSSVYGTVTARISIQFASTDAPGAGAGVSSVSFTETVLVDATVTSGARRVTFTQTQVDACIAALDDASTVALLVENDETTGVGKSFTREEVAVRSGDLAAGDALNHAHVTYYMGVRTPYGGTTVQHWTLQVARQGRTGSVATGTTGFFAGKVRVIARKLTVI